MKTTLLCAALLLAVACSATTGLKPVQSTDPEAACPAGRLAWDLQISDQRAEREDSVRLIALVRDSITRSFPGCRWSPASNSVGTISIEIHRFASKLDGSIWDAAAEWSVSVRDTDGRAMTDFECSSEISRPNYRNVNNEQASLQQVLEEAAQRTLKGLRAMSSAQ